MWPFSQTKKHEHGRALLVDIGSASIGAAIARFSKEQKPLLEITTRNDIVFQENLNFKRFVSATTEALTKTLNQIQKRSSARPDHIHCVLSSPWFVSQTRV